MSYADFIQSYLGILNDKDYNPDTLQILGKSLDCLSTGWVY